MRALLPALWLAGSSDHGGELRHRSRRWAQRSGLPAQAAGCLGSSRRSTQEQSPAPRQQPSGANPSPGTSAGHHTAPAHRQQAAPASGTAAAVASRRPTARPSTSQQLSPEQQQEELRLLLDHYGPQPLALQSFAGVTSSRSGSLDTEKAPVSEPSTSARPQDADQGSPSAPGPLSASAAVYAPVLRLARRSAPSPQPPAAATPLPQPLPSASPQPQQPHTAFLTLRLTSGPGPSSDGGPPASAAEAPAQPSSAAPAPPARPLGRTPSSQADFLQPPDLLSQREELQRNRQPVSPAAVAGTEDSKDHLRRRQRGQQASPQRSVQPDPLVPRVEEVVKEDDTSASPSTNTSKAAAAEAVERQHSRQHTPPTALPRLPAARDPSTPCGEEASSTPDSQARLAARAALRAASAETAAHRDRPPLAPTSAGVVELEASPSGGVTVSAEQEEAELAARFPDAGPIARRALGRLLRLPPSSLYLSPEEKRAVWDPAAEAEEAAAGASASGMGVESGAAGEAPGARLASGNALWTVDCGLHGTAVSGNAREVVAAAAASAARRPSSSGLRSSSASSAGLANSSRRDAEPSDYLRHVRALPVQILVRQPHPYGRAEVYELPDWGQVITHGHISRVLSSGGSSSRAPLPHCSARAAHGWVFTSSGCSAVRRSVAPSGRAARDPCATPRGRRGVRCRAAAGRRRSWS
jgi:hypothetical protein